ncbi:MAG: hypothetical protein IPJ65_41160 [Archangiaceae bacterium]|nr:hypothetical protein [Archangiaceae bacterium]
MKRWGWAAVVGLCSACGPQAVLFLRVEAPLVVPDQCDALQVRVRRDSALAMPAIDTTFSLLNGPQFPLTLDVQARQPSDFEPRTLFVEVNALKDSAPAFEWAHGSAQTTLHDGAVSPVLIKLCDCSG